MKDTELFTDQEAVKELLQLNLPGFSGGSLSIVDCRLVGLKRLKPREQKPRLRVDCLLDVSNPRTGTQGQQRVYLNIYAKGESGKACAKAKEACLWPPGFGEPLVHLPAHDAIIWAFPNDAKLPSLPDLTNAETAKQHLPFDRLPDGFKDPDDIIDLCLSVARYHSERRCTIKYDLRRGSGNDQESFVLFGKVFKSSDEAPNQSDLERLWQWSSRHKHAFRVPEPLGHDAAIDVYWQSEVSGKPLIEAIDRETCEPLMERAGRGLAALHNADLQSVYTTEIDANLQQMRRYANDLAASAKAGRALLDELIRRAEETKPILDDGDVRSIHGGFRVNQLLEDKGVLGLIDFDDFARGDPMLDLASFLVDLKAGTFDPDMAERMASAFAHSYRRHAKVRIASERLDWHLTNQAIKRAAWLYRRRRSSSDRQARRLLGRAQTNALRQGPL